AEALTPELVGADHRLQEALLLVGRAVADDRRSHDEAGRRGMTGHPDKRHLLVVNELLGERQVHPTPLPGPGGRRPTLVSQRDRPPALEGEAPGRVPGGPARMVADEEGSQLLAESLVRFPEREV